MPWSELSPMDCRMRFITDWQSGQWTMTELCAEYRVSRKTGYKWVTRYAAEGPGGLHDRSRRPREYGHATDAAIVAVFVGLRTRHPHWGAKKLRRIALTRRIIAADDCPARSTICALLAARGLVRARRRRQRSPLHTPQPFAPVLAPNDLWTVDFKGEFRLGNRAYCYPLTLRDGFSRYVLRCDALSGCGYADTRRRFERAFAAFGLPRRIRSDNGNPFASPGLAGLSRLSVWWMRLGITPERIVPGHPEQNGSHEQFHAVLKTHTALPPAAQVAAQQRRFTRFCREYNTVRPHDALAETVPADHYRPSPRSLPPALPALEYAGHWEVRRVSSIGCVTWRSQQLFVAAPLAGQDVAFEAIDTGLWTLWFGATALARYHDRTRTLHPIIPFSRGRSAASPPRA